MSGKIIFHKIFSILILILSIIILVAGYLQTYKVFDEEMNEFNIPVFYKVSEKELIIDSTFGGVTRKNSKLYTTYNRNIKQSKRPCPT